MWTNAVLLLYYCFIFE